MAKFRIVETFKDGVHDGYKVEENYSFFDKVDSWRRVDSSALTFLNSYEECEAYITRRLKPLPKYTTRVVKEYG